MRRTCPACKQDYDHAPVTADGPMRGAPRVHLIVCSWDCLIQDISERVNPK